MEMSEYIREETKNKGKGRDKNKRKGSRDKNESNREAKKKDRKVQLNIRISQAEKRKLQRKAEKNGLNLSEYIRIRSLVEDGKQQSPGMANQCVVICQDILNIVEEKYSCEDNSLLEEKVEKLWKIL